MTVIDLHTHILPFMDDGAHSVEESEKMVFESISQGIKICALTPHCVIHDEMDIEDFLVRREKSFNKLNSFFKESTIEVLLGAEVFIDNDINRYKEILRLCIGSTNCILLELPLGRKYDWLSECVYNLNIKGVKVIIAHIDRYPMWKEILKELRSMEVIYQINAGRFLTISGRRLIRKILSFDEKFIVSSDTHNLERRKCNMKEAKIVADKKFSEMADDLFFRNAAKTLSMQGWF